MMSEETVKGSCLCGSVTYEAKNPRREVTACHCSQCRKQSGHFWASSGCAIEDFKLHTEEGLKWYRASDFAKRGFCPTCGSFLFWKHDDETKMSFSLGQIDGPSNLCLKRHIFVADKGDYYDIADHIPQRAD